MINKNHAGRLLAISVITVFLGLIILSGCTDEKEVVKTETVTVHDTVFITITMRDTVTIVDTLNNVMVDTVLINPDSITVGKSVMLTANVSTLPGVGSLNFTWSANAGTFDSQTGDTVNWTAPDDAGVYMIKVIAEDGTYSGLATRMIGVGMYVPTTTPFFIGADACGGCHAGITPEIWNGWLETHHAHAWETLQNSGHAASYCNPCHAAGWDYDYSQIPPIPVANTGNSGFDEAPIQKFVNVQCENCHGPGSDHAQGPSPANIEKHYDALVCARCHDGEHHPFYTEWEQSPHNFDPSFFATTNSFCQGCHEGVAAGIRLSGEAAAYPLGAGNFYGGGSIAERPDTSQVSLQPHTCPTCHDPHSDENPGQVRTVADVQLVTANNESPVVTEGGVGRLCMQCHHARRAAEGQIQNGYEHFGPHANPQADMMKGASAYHGVADTNFVWAGPSHLNVQNSCKTCHIHTHDYGGTGEPAVTGHVFLPTVEACEQCHGPITDFDEIMALEDFDGDGNVEGVQSEVEGLSDLLVEALVADGLDTLGVGVEGALGDTTRSTFIQREAGYNWAFVHDDKSHGVHNPDYAVQLLQQSIQHLTGTPVPNAYIVRFDNEVVSNW